MKSMVVYSSQTGNTKKLAEAVYDRITSEKALHVVADAPDPREADVVLVGFWLQAGKPDPASIDYLKRIQGEKLFIFATHGAAAGSEHADQAVAYAKSLVPRADLLGVFTCQGQVNPKVLEKAGKKDPKPPWLDDAAGAVGHPDESDINRLTELLQSVAPEITS